MSTADGTRFSADAQPPQKGWFGRNWLWALPSGLLVLCLCPVGCCAGIFTFASGIIKSSEPYQTALSRAQNDPAVIERLGQPIEAGMFTQGNVNINNTVGDARLTIPISGPQGSAQINTTATRANSIWQTDTLTVDFPDGTQIDLLEVQVP
jgi:hypothetical protein